MIYTDKINSDYFEMLKRPGAVHTAKIEILDEQENAVGETDEVLSGNINIQYKQGITRTATLSFPAQQITEYSPFWINRKIKVYKGIRSENDIFFFSQGIFIVKDISVSSDSLNVNAVDKFAALNGDLNQGITQGTYTVPAGTNLKNLIQDTLLITDSRQVADCKPAIIDNCFYSSSLPYDITANSGSSIGKILTDAASAFDADIYYNPQGYLKFQKAVSNYNYAPVQHDFSEDDIFSCSFDLDFSKIINQITVYGSDTDGRILEYTASNVNPVSPVNIKTIGIKSEAPETNEACYSLDRCRDYAEYKLKQSALISCSGRLECRLVPHLTANDVVTVAHSKLGYNREKFIIQSISLPLSADKMSLNVCNIKYL